MNKSEKQKILLIGLTSVGIVLLDQIIKFIITKTMAIGQSIPLVPNIFHLTYIQNTGAGFGLFPGATRLLIWFSIIVIGLIFYFYDQIPKGRCPQLAIAAILGGTFSNLIDRINLSYVIDFFDFRVWPAFNIADMAITIGVISLIIYLLKNKE